MSKTIITSTTDWKFFLKDGFYHEGNYPENLNWQFNQKFKAFHHLLILMSFQTCITFFCGTQNIYGNPTLTSLTSKCMDAKPPKHFSKYFVVFHRKKNATKVSNNLRVNKYQTFCFWLSYPFIFFKNTTRILKKNSSPFRLNRTTFHVSATAFTFL